MVSFLKLSIGLLVCLSGVISLSFDLSSDRRLLSPEENEQRKTTCGRFSGSRPKRALYGDVADPGDAPWAASITYTPKWFPEMANHIFEEHQMVVCTGTLISPRHVLAAASCLRIIDADCNNQLVQEVEKKNVARFRVHVGGTCSHPGRCRQLQRDDRLVMRTVQRVFIPSTSVGTVCGGDASTSIAVFELSSDVEFRQNLYPACILDWKEEKTLLKKVRLSGVVAGYGLDVAQHKSRMPQVGVLKISDQTQTCLRDHHFCTTSDLDGLCAGDIGAGFVTPVGGRSAVLGVFYDASINCGRLNQFRNMGKASKLIRKTKSGDDIENKFAFLSQHDIFICQVAGICSKDAGEMVARIEKLPPTSRPKVAAEISPLEYEDMFA